MIRFEFKEVASDRHEILYQGKLVGFLIQEFIDGSKVRPWGIYDVKERALSLPGFAKNKSTFPALNGAKAHANKFAEKLLAVERSSLFLQEDRFEEIIAAYEKGNLPAEEDLPPELEADIDAYNDAFIKAAVSMKKFFEASVDEEQKSATLFGLGMGFIDTLVDCTERKKAFELLADMKEQLEMILPEKVN